MNWRRISALILRYNYLYRRNLGRILDVLFWPVFELIIWGFLSVYLLKSGASVPLFVSFLLGALMLWEVVYRANLGVAASFLEDLWTRNFLNLFASPLTSNEFIAGLMLSSFIRVLVSSGVLVVLAIVFYSFNILTLGLPLVAFFICLLMFGWSMGIISIALILRFGQSAEMLAWAFVALFQPFAAVFYPVAVLPKALQIVARFVPASHVFEGMRTLIQTGAFDWSAFIWSVVLNLIYLILALAAFSIVFRRAKTQGYLSRMWQ